MKRMLVLVFLIFSFSALASDKVLFLMTAADTQHLRNGKIRQTGYFLNEFYEAYEAVKKAGLVAEFASPGGKAPTIDEESLNVKYWDSAEALESAKKDVASIKGLEKPFTIKEANERFSEYKAIVVPGGQGVMIDLFHDLEAIALVERFGRENKIVGLICHSPALLLKMKGDHPFKNRKVTAVSFLEEIFIEKIVMGGKAAYRLIGKKLKRAGFKFSSAFPGSGKAVRDGNLITSQNPFSGKEFNKLFSQALEE